MILRPPVDTIEHMFATRLHSLGGHLLDIAADIDPDLMTAAQAAEVIREAAEIERTAAGIRLRSAHRIDNESLWGEGGDRSAAEWMGKHTGQSAADAQRDLECSRRLRALPAADDAMKKGELSPDQAKTIADAASEDPDCEDELVDTAKRASFGELARKAKARKAAALGDDEARHRAAHKNRSFKKGTNAAGEGWGRFNGPADMNARLNARLKPFLDDVFAQAREQGRRERTDAHQYDALMAALGLTDATAGSGAAKDTDKDDDGDVNDGDVNDGDRGRPTPKGGPPSPAPVPTPRASGRGAQLILRIDAAALKRGHTQAGELCEIQGVGPVPVAAIREFLPDAAIAVVVTNGVDVFNVTNFSRRANALQQIVLDLLNIGCTRLGCAATEHLQIDHRADWAKTRVTELASLDWLCVHDHRLKTHEGWQLEPGAGKRAMHPPGQQSWLDDPPGGPPDHAAA